MSMMPPAPPGSIDPFANLNWDDAFKAEDEGGDFSPIPASVYPVRVEEAQALPASTGSPMLKLRLSVVGGPYNGRLIWTNIVWKADNEGSLRMFMVKLKAFGFTREWMDTHRPGLNQLAQLLVGRSASATVEIKDYQGSPTNNVSKLAPLTGGGNPGAAAPTAGGVPPVAPPPVPPVAAPPVAPPAAVAPPPVPPPVAPPVAPTAPAVAAPVAQEPLVAPPVMDPSSAPPAPAEAPVATTPPPAPAPAPVPPAPAPQPPSEDPF